MAEPLKPSPKSIIMPLTVGMELLVACSMFMLMRHLMEEPHIGRLITFNYKKEVFLTDII